MAWRDAIFSVFKALSSTISTGPVGTAGSVGAPGTSGTAPHSPTPRPDDDAIRVEYAPQRDGDADPGEVVWAWVPYEDDPAQGKDRPVLLLARRADVWLTLMLSSQDHDRDAADEARYGRYWMDVGTGGWDREGRPSEVRLDRLIEIPGDQIRREGAALGRATFDTVVEAARRFHDFT